MSADREFKIQTAAAGLFGDALLAGSIWARVVGAGPLVVDGLVMVGGIALVGAFVGWALIRFSPPPKEPV